MGTNNMETNSITHDSTMPEEGEQEMPEVIVSKTPVRYNADGERLYCKYRDTMDKYGFPRGSQGFEMSNMIKNTDINRVRANALYSKPLMIPK